MYANGKRYTLIRGDTDILCRFAGVSAIAVSRSDAVGFVERASAREVIVRKAADGTDKTVLIVNGIVLNSQEQELTAHNHTHHVTPTECRLLWTLMQHAGEALTRKFLMQSVWQTNYTGDTRTLEVHISWLRSKIEADPRKPQLIQTVRGVGYRFCDG